METKQLAINKLANLMRIYVETHINFHQLKIIDKEEAIDNLDRAFEAMLEAFHSLYDVSKSDIDYFSHADTAAIILLRNAIHHRDHLLFKSWNKEMALNDGYKKYLGAEFLLVSYTISGSPCKMRYFYKMKDFYHRLDEKLASPYLDRHMRADKRKILMDQLDTELHFSDIKYHARDERYPDDQVYINVMPIFISAVGRVFRTLKNQGVDFIGFDSLTYEKPFTGELEVDFYDIVYNPLRIL